MVELDVGVTPHRTGQIPVYSANFSSIQRMMKMA